jgi:hypothetical protein
MSFSYPLSLGWRFIMKRTRHPDGFDLKAVAATVAFAAVIAGAAFLGHQQAVAPSDGVKPAHHMASLAEIQAVLKKAQADDNQ